MLLNNRFDIGTVICPRAVVLIYYLMTILLHNYYLFKTHKLKKNTSFEYVVSIFFS